MPGARTVLDRAKVAAHVIEHRGYFGLGQLFNQPEQLLTLRSCCVLEAGPGLRVEVPSG